MAARPVPPSPSVQITGQVPTHLKGQKGPKEEEKKKTVGGYAVIGKKLGKGGYGTVWPVEDAQGQKWAMKEITIQPDAAGGLDARIVREPATQDALKHPNVVELHEVIHDYENSKLYMVMPLAQDKSLHEKMKAWKKVRTKNLAEKTARLREKFKCAGDIICGLEYLWARGFMHLDLKNENVLVFEDGSYRIADYGLAMFVTTPFVATRAKSVVTWAWKPPELLCHKDRWDYTVDIWSLGVILVELFHNTNPFFDDVKHERLLLPFIAERVGWDPDTGDFPKCPQAARLKTMPQKNGFALAASILSGGEPEAIAWRESYGQKVFDAIWQLISGCLQVVPSERKITIPPLLFGLLHRSKCLMIDPTPVVVPAAGTEIADMFGPHDNWGWDSLEPDTQSLAQHIWTSFMAKGAAAAASPNYLSAPGSRPKFATSQLTAAACVNLASKAIDDFILFSPLTLFKKQLDDVTDYELLIERALNFGIWRDALAKQRLHLVPNNPSAALSSSSSSSSSVSAK